MKEKKKVYQKSWFWVCVVLTLCTISVIVIFINNKTANTTGNVNVVDIYDNAPKNQYSMEDIYDYASLIDSSISDIHNYIMLEDEKLLNYAIDELNGAMEQFDNYNNYINSLADTKYNNLKKYWMDYSEEINALYLKVKNKEYTTRDGIISNDRLSTFYYYLCEETYNLK